MSTRGAPLRRTKGTKKTDQAVGGAESARGVLLVCGGHCGGGRGERHDTTSKRWFPDSPPVCRVALDQRNAAIGAVALSNAHPQWSERGSEPLPAEQAGDAHRRQALAEAGVPWPTFDR